jgi:activator of HSP90 ATPase
MSTYDYELEHVLPVPPGTVYDAWMSSEGHTAMTGSPAVVDPTVGGGYSAWDGYITGKNLELETYKRIVQSWRPADFRDDDADSQIEVVLEAIDDGTLLKLRHTKVPSHNHSYQEGGWQDSYFAPMSEYFQAIYDSRDHGPDVLSVIDGI